MPRLTADEIQEYEGRKARLQRRFKPHPFSLVRPKSEFPELVVHVPSTWKSILLAPLFDRHYGNSLEDVPLWEKHRDWIRRTPNVISWNGGDLFENITDPKMGHTTKDNTEQYLCALEEVATIRHKMAFAIPGNHEARTYKRAGMDSAALLADDLNIPYFPDYALVTFVWRNLRFKLAAHHGTGSAQTAGAQRMAARKDLSWLKPDLLWTGHLHQPIVDPVNVMDYDQRKGQWFERTIMVLISPSYLRYFGGYAASKRLGFGARGISVAELHDDGRIDVTVHARGRRI